MSSQPDGAAQLRRTITLSGSIALVVGGVVGAGIFVLVRDVGAQAGGAIWLAFAIAILVSLVGVLPVIQLAGALPRAGAGYVFSSRLLSPFAGVMTSYWVILGGGASTSVVSLTLAVYVRDYLPFGVPVPILAMSILLLFYLVYLVGVRLAMSLQVLMALQFVIALVIYGVAGLLLTDVEVALVPPRGAGAFLMAVLLCYSMCLGFQVIAEMGEEIRNARRTIPLALLIGGGVVAAIYIVVGVVFVGSIPYDPEVYGNLRAPLGESAGLFLPVWFIPFLELGALTAGLTSFNAAALALPRELFAQARDGVMPAWLGRISARTHAPQNAITAFFLFVAALLAAGWDTEFYGYLAAVGILIMSSVMCVAALRLGRVFPERYAAAYIRFPRPLMVVCTVITVIVSLGFTLVVWFEAPGVIGVYAVWTALVAAYYLIRRRFFTAEDLARLRVLPGHDEVPEPPRR